MYFSDVQVKNRQLHALLRASKNELSLAQLLAAHVMFATNGEKFHF